MSGTTTTSGLAWKIPGRVGDSPLIGAGLFVDQEVGGAGSTGLGEENIRIAGGHTVVENMRHGMSPKDACLDALQRIGRNFNNDHARLARFDIFFYALRADGAYAGASLWSSRRATAPWPRRSSPSIPAARAGSRIAPGCWNASPDAARAARPCDSGSMLVAAAIMAMLASQTPVVGCVEVFGARKIPQERILKAIGVKPGDPLPPSKATLEDTLLGVEGVARASVEAFCCEGGQAILYVESKSAAPRRSPCATGLRSTSSCRPRSSRCTTTTPSRWPMRCAKATWWRTFRRATR